MTGSDQLQPGDTLDDSVVDDVLDEGISPPERLLGSTAKGTTAAEAREGETLDERIAQEEPEDAPSDPNRSGRLVAPDEGLGEDTEKDMVARDAGISGGAASAEEAAMHDVDEP
ncbi:MAG: DUF5709 domain-containing protein [Aeromicrobium sp.]